MNWKNGENSLTRQLGTTKFLTAEPDQMKDAVSIKGPLWAYLISQCHCSICVCSVGTDQSFCSTRAIWTQSSPFDSSLRLSPSMYSTLQQYYTKRIHLLIQFAFNLLHSSSVGSILFHHQTSFFSPNPVWSGLVHYNSVCIQKGADCSFCVKQHLAVTPEKKMRAGTSVYGLH